MDILKKSTLIIGALLTLNVNPPAVHAENLKTEKQLENLKYRALRHCEKGDKCIAVRKTCQDWIAVRDIYEKEAYNFFIRGIILQPCDRLAEESSKPVARCINTLKECILTGEKELILDPRIQAQEDK